MSILNFLFGWLGDDSIAEPEDDLKSQHFDAGCSINPASGLPMVGGDCGGVDVGGNPYGMDMDHDWGTPGLHDDSWLS